VTGAAGQVPAGGSPGGLHARPQVLLERLLASVRPEFRQDVLVFALDDPVFGGAACRVPQCGRWSAAFGLCQAHYRRWDQAGRPDPGQFAAAAVPVPWHGPGPLPPCRVPGCGFGAKRHLLCPRHDQAWSRAGEPELPGWLAGSARPPADSPGWAPCLVGPCELWAEPTSPLCYPHLRRWWRRGRPDLAGFARACGEPEAARQRADLTPLPGRMRLEVQYALQCRSDDKTVRNGPDIVRMAIRMLAGSGAGSLLERTEQEWRDACPDPPASHSAITALVAYAHRKVTTLAEGEGWDNEYPRDTWQLRRLGIASSHQAILQFGKIPQPWLKDLAKRWTRWRLSAGMAAVTCYAGVTAITRFAAFLQAAGITRPAQVDRGTLERYLPELHRALAGRASHRHEIGLLNTFLHDVRRHQWEASLPPGAMFFPEDYPRQPQALPRFLAEQVMAQVEDPANLARLGNPAYELITLILIRCGLRITDATSLPSGCITRDAGGAPYLRYYNRKMKREALVPVDEELDELIRSQQDRVRASWPDPPPVLFPRPFANIDGTRPIRSATYRTALCRWLERCDIRDEHGQPVRLTPHQWRHTLGTRLINRDVPQHIVQKILDHDSPEMTAHYARLSDKTVREQWEKARKVSATGQPVRISPDGPLGDAAWARHHLSRATQALPNGYCQLPMVKTCPHANSCLTCPMFVTTAEFLPQHQAHRQATLQLITAAEAAGHARVAEMNKQVASNLGKIITALEAASHDDERQAAASAS
jgi:integrase